MVSLNGPCTGAGAGGGFAAIAKPWAAYLEAADKIDCRPPSKRVAMAKPINVEAHQASVAPVSPQVASLVPTPSPLVFQRANLVRV